MEKGETAHYERVFFTDDVFSPVRKSQFLCINLLSGYSFNLKEAKICCLVISYEPFSHVKHQLLP